MAAKKSSKAPAAKKTLGKSALKRVKGGGTANLKQMQDMTNNLQTTAQKAADKTDQYIRS